MLGYLLRRVLAAIPVMGVVALFVFLLLRLTPGDPAAILAGDNATPEQLERIRVSLGVIFSIRVSCCGASAGPSGMTSRPPTLSCSISGGGTCPSAAVTIIASKGPHSGHPR